MGVCVCVCRERERERERQRQRQRERNREKDKDKQMNRSGLHSDLLNSIFSFGIFSRTTFFVWTTLGATSSLFAKPRSLFWTSVRAWLCKINNGRLGACY